MSVTRLDLKESAFGIELHEVTEVQLTNRGLVDLGCLVRECPNVQNLNLAFNSLAALQGLGQLTNLSHLNVSHNQLVSVKGLSTLVKLTSLNCSHNRLQNLAGLSSCSGLQDLWCNHNQLKSVSDLSTLQSLTRLERLCLAPNPATVKGVPPSVYRALVAAMCPALKVLDGQIITDQDRAAAASINIQDHLQPPLPPPSPPVEHRPPSGSPAPQLAGMPGASQTSSLLRDGLPGSRGRLPPRSSRTLSGPGPPRPRKLPTPDNTPPVVPGRRAASEGRGSSYGRSSTGSVQSEDDLISLLSGADSLFLGSAGGSSQRRTSLGSKHIPRIRELPPDSKFAAVLSALPVIDPAKVPDKHKYNPSKIGETVVKKQPPPKPPPEASITAGEIKYSNGSRGRAVTVRADGSVSSTFPNGDLAVSVDSDYATRPPTYRLFAQFRVGGNVAASWDSTGGFVQYPSGNLCINYSAASGSGTLFGPAGDTLLKWKDDDRDSGVSPYVDMALDQHFGVRYDKQRRALSLYMSCEGVRFKFVCGPNTSSNTWDAPAGRRAASSSELNQDGASAGEVARPNSPPPPFLAQLAAESGMGSLRQDMVRTMRSIGDGTQAIPPSSAADGIAAVTAALKALDRGLFDKLA